MMPKVATRESAEAVEKKDETADGLRPYLFHGFDLDEGPSGQAVGECLFCGKAKFSVVPETGVAHCWTCTINPDGDKGGVNPISFLRCLHKRSDEQTTEYGEFAAERGLADEMTLSHWGVCRSAFTGDWLVPGHDAEGRLCQLYRRLRVGDRWEMRPTPTLPHAMIGVPLFDKAKGTVYLHESWGNALAWWEALRAAKRAEGGGLALTGAEAGSLLADANVLAVANCGAVGEPLKRYLPLFAGKHVVLVFDSDRPPPSGAEPAGLAACKRAAKLLAGAKEPPASISYLKWGQDGYDSELPGGHDVRDALLAAGPSLAARLPVLDGLLRKVEAVPAEWVEGARESHAQEIQPRECKSWADLLTAWKKALFWRRDLEDALTVMAAVAVSTEQTGDQLFFMMLGDAGSAKTRLCDAFLVSKGCHALEHLTGFHSGYQDGTGDDFSLISRINGKMLITPEGDVMMASPSFDQIMSQIRRIFDGTSGASYKNQKVDVRHTGLRTPWVMAGTPALLDKDQSRLGDRFMRIVIGQPSTEEKRQILMSVVNASFDSVEQTSNGDASSHVSGAMLKAYRLTGGYVDHLRANAGRLIAGVKKQRAKLAERIIDLADFVADMRARPNADRRVTDPNDTKEQPTRVASQLARLATCIAAATQRGEINAEVMRLVRKVALDTSRGRTFKLAKVLAGAKPPGATASALATCTGETEERELTVLAFLRKIDVVEPFTDSHGVKRWRLTARFAALWRNVMGVEKAK
jgi:hypothetical protein